MNQQFGLWLYPLLLFSVIGMVMRMRVPLSWGWSFLLQALSVCVVSLVGLTVGSDWICAGVGWVMFVVFFVMPRIYVGKIENNIALLNAQGALASADMLQYFYWGKPGKFWMDMARAYDCFIKGDAVNAETILKQWQTEHDLPKELNDLISSYRLTGHVILWDWQGIINEFEQRQARPNSKIPSALYISASRAYAELGRIEEATTCLEKANLVDSRAGIKSLALTLLPYMCLAGALNYVNQLRELITVDNRETLPEYSEFYWLGRCLTAMGNADAAKAAYEQALSVLDEHAANALAWRKRINYQLEHLTEKLTNKDWSSETARVFRIFQQAQFVQEIVSPRKSSPVVAALAISIVAVFIVTNIYRFFPSEQNVQLADQIMRFGWLEPKKVLAGEYWRLVTYLFLHKHETHCLLNVLGLYWFGRIAQNIFGTTRFLSIYFMAGILSGIAHSVLQPDTLAVGASGAVMGVFGAVAAGIYRLKDQLPQSMRRTELMWMGGLAIMQIVLDRIVPQVAAFAHLGGIVAGVVFGMIVAVPRPAFEEPPVRTSTDLLT